MEKTEILAKLKQYLETELPKEDTKESEKQNMISACHGLTAEDLSLGEPPRYFYGYLECNSTGVGRSSFGNTQSQRTVALDYTTDEMLFIDGDKDTCVKGMEILVLSPGETCEYYHKDDMKKCANDKGLQLHAQSFRDLNFVMYNHRVNRFKFHQTKKPFSLPIRAIFATQGKSKPFRVGYVYEDDEGEKVLFEIDAFKKKKLPKGCIIGLIGLVCPPVLLGLLGYLIYKLLKKLFYGV